MSCFLCGSDHPDTFFLDSGILDEETESANEFSACSACLKEAGFDLSKMESVFSLFLHHGASNRHSPVNMGDRVTNELQVTCDPKCKYCGISIMDLINTGVVGCEKCYESYADFIKEYLFAIREGAVDKASSDILAKLNTAIEEENYEQAAELRDILESRNCR